ncbi:P22 phage major capsid protein family protein [Demequina muriae]|uniref:P22 phage major capsid protein family protein n=1 Tax=Demequina muriae TaxID=3051664 RepID=A0ABT8GEP0_9MICO|nr:P22 phage major capsid protein family protein [Demequina sp. EGI L300058]MDN4479903.1 P22 phage major capsid protein family protein [Demequina sp. EGI L300058]
MPNEFLNPEKVAALAATLAAADLGLTQHVYRDVASDFGQGVSGKTVQIRVPGVTTTGSRPVGSTENYVQGSLTETSIPVTLENEIYSSVPITLDEADLELKDFGAQVLRPQGQSVAHQIDKAVADAMAATSPEASIVYDSTNPRASLIRARAVLRARGVNANRALTAIVGANVFADLAEANVLEPAANGTYHVAGMAVVENTLVSPYALYVMVKEAFVAAVRAPVPPHGAVTAASVTASGMALTHMIGLNIANGVSSSVLTAFVGVAPLPLAVANYESGSVDLVDGGGVVAVNTTGA